jgi:signal transduction histidine kinase
VKAVRSSFRDLSIHAQVAAIASISLLLGTASAVCLLVICTRCCAVREEASRSSGSDLPHTHSREAMRMRELLTAAEASGFQARRVIHLNSSLADVVDGSWDAGFDLLAPHEALWFPLDPQTAMVFESRAASHELWYALLLMSGATLIVMISALLFWIRSRVAAPLAALEQKASGVHRVLPIHSPRTLMRIADAMDQLTAQSVKARERRVQALAAVSHDLRLPLTRLRLRAERVSEDLRISMLREIDGMTRMLEMTLAAVREDAQLALKSKVDLASLLQTLCDEFADVGYEVHYAGPLRMSCHCSPELLARAISNVIDNAIKHASHVGVFLRTNEGAIEIDIADDGPGIPQSQREQLFEPFIKATANHRAGFGLGLSIARDVVQAHGGSIRMLDELPHGLRVRITLPMD